MAKGKKKTKSTFKFRWSPKKLFIVGFFVVVLLGLLMYIYQASLDILDKTSMSGVFTTPKQTKTFIGTPTPTVLPYKESTMIENPPQKVVVENGYALVPELGIKFKVENDLNYLIYSFSYYGSNSQNYQTSSYVRFTTQSLLNLDKGCTAEYGPLGSIGKSLENPYMENIGGGPMKNEVKQIGGYYYHYLHPQAFCGNISDVNDLEMEQIKLLRAAFQTLEPIQ